MLKTHESVARLALIKNEQDKQDEQLDRKMNQITSRLAELEVHQGELVSCRETTFTAESNADGIEQFYEKAVSNIDEALVVVTYALSGN